MLFIHDHTFVINDDKYYTTGSLNQKVMDRYKTWFGEVSVFANYRCATEKDNVYVRSENCVEDINFRLVPKKNSLFNLIKCCKKIKEEVKKTDCVVSRMSIFGAIGIHYAKKYKKKYLVEMVACPWDSLWYHSKKGKILAPFMTLLTKRICKNAPYVLYVTNEFLQKRYPTKGKSIGCSDVELCEINNEIFEKRINKIKETDITKIKLCTVANVEVKYKGQDLVIDSLKTLKESGIECEYYLIGGGNPDRLYDLAKKDNVSDLVKIIGPKPHNEIFEYLDKIDIYIQPSYQEGLPRAVIEAMSRGCPIIGSNAGGIPELINKKCVFKKGKRKDFLKIMELLNREKLLNYSKENFKSSIKYEKKYLDEKREKFYLEFYNE